MSLTDYALAKDESEGSPAVPDRLAVQIRPLGYFLLLEDRVEPVKQLLE